MEQQNVVNGIICSMAKIHKESEKAYQLSYVADIYGESFAVKNVWFAKSQLEIHKKENDVIWFVPKNDWVLDANTRKYAQSIADMFPVKSEIKMYLSMSHEKVEQVFC